MGGGVASFCASARLGGKLRGHSSPFSGVAMCLALLSRWFCSRGACCLVACLLRKAMLRCCAGSSFLGEKSQFVLGLPLDISCVHLPRVQKVFPTCVVTLSGS